jgi:hypothetical protein
MAWPLIAAAIASSLIQGYNQYRTAQKQDQAAAAGLARQRGFQEQANARMAQQLDELEKSTPEDERQTLEGQIRSQLRAKQAQALAGLRSDVGSDDADVYAAAAAPVAVDYGDFINDVVSRRDAPVIQRRGETYDRADVESYLNFMRRNSAQERNLTNLQIAGIRPNPWLTMASNVLGAYATSGGFGGMGMSGQPQSQLMSLTPQQFYGASQPLANAPITMMNPDLMNQPIIGSIFGNGRRG